MVSCFLGTFCQWHTYLLYAHTHFKPTYPVSQIYLLFFAPFACVAVNQKDSTCLHRLNLVTDYKEEEKKSTWGAVQSMESMQLNALLPREATLNSPSGFYWFSLTSPASLTGIILLPDFMHGVTSMESRPLICVICTACNLPLICFFNLSPIRGSSLDLLDCHPDSIAPICSVLLLIPTRGLVKQEQVFCTLLTKCAYAKLAKLPYTLPMELGSAA